MSHQKAFRYPSNLGATRKIDAPNYLAEFIILRHANNKNIKLPDRIWDKKFLKMLQWKYWYGLYYGELKRARTLLKTFELNDIITALKENEGKVILSLVNDKLLRLAREAKTKRELLELSKETIDVVVAEPNTLPRQSYGYQSKLGKLR